MDERRLAQIKERVEAATEGPWRLGDYRGVGEDHDIERADGEPLDGVFRGMFARRADAELAAAAREDVPALVEEIERLWRQQGSEKETRAEKSPHHPRSFPHYSGGRVRRGIEVDLRRLDEALLDDGYAREMYAALCGNEWVYDSDPERQRCSYSARAAGALVSHLRALGESYGEFFIDLDSPLRQGQITDKVRSDLAELGWRPAGEQ